MRSLIFSERISRLIYLVRGHRVMLDSDLAELYGVPTSRLNEQVKRNRRRFPEDFMFQITRKEGTSLRSQFAILKTGRGRHRKYLPYAFTEQGVAMLSSVLNSSRAIQVNIAIMRAFVNLRKVLAAHRDLAKQLEAIERRLAGHDADIGEHAGQIQAVFEAIRQLMRPLEKPKRRIGFVGPESDP